MAYRSEDPGRANEQRAKEEADRAEIERVKRGLRPGLPSIGQVARSVARPVGWVVAVIALVLITWTVNKRLKPCRGEYARCIDATHLEVCEDGEGPALVAHCTQCISGGRCATGDIPIAGDLCERCNGPYSRPQEDYACSADKRSVIVCRGCMNVWTLSQRCAADEVCGPRPNEYDGCVKR